jgi:hypothetical protein
MGDMGKRVQGIRGLGLSTGLGCYYSMGMGIRVPKENVNLRGKFGINCVSSSH